MTELQTPEGTSDEAWPADGPDNTSPDHTSPDREAAVATLAAPDPAEGNNYLGAAVLIGLLGYLWYAAGFNAIIVVAGIFFMIFMHELGHYLTAKSAGMKVSEFFIGFGPRIWSFRRGETEYGIKGIPAGAYVRVLGMNNLEPVEPSEEHRTYRQAPYWRRMSVVLAGSAMHFLLAIICLFVLFAGFNFYGLQGPPSDAWNVGRVVEDSAAADIGFEEGDIIVSAIAADGRRAEITEFGHLSGFVVSRPGEIAEFEVIRDEQTITLIGAIGVSETDPDRGFLGIGRGCCRVIPDKGVGRALEQTLPEFGTAIKVSGEGLYAFFRPSNLASFFGDVVGTEDTASAPAAGGGGAAQIDTGTEGEGRVLSIFGVARIGVGLDLEPLLVLYVAINVFVGLFNLVPMLPLDGGHALIATYERLRSWGGRRHFADITRLLPLTYMVVLFLVAVGLGALWLDISDPIDIN